MRYRRRGSFRGRGRRNYGRRRSRRSYSGRRRSVRPMRIGYRF